jgi:pimeloyl-ACP methyl ester carboxylesterase
MTNCRNREEHAVADVPIAQRSLDANGFSFSFLEAGEGPLALCLHGFPDTAESWRPLLGELAAAGYHAVAPFLRGYAPTTVPPDGNFTMGALVADACALHDALGGDTTAVVIGHDWGAGTAWAAAAYAPSRWSKAVIMAVPPPAVGLPFMGTYDQMKRSWYMAVCASPYAEAIASANDFEFIDRLWADWSPGFDATDALRSVHECFSVPGSLAAALSYYAAALNPSADPGEFVDAHGAGVALAEQPVLYLHGVDDGCIGSSVVPAARDYLTVPGSRVELVEGAGHFLQVERPAEVNRLVLEFLRP